MSTFSTVSELEPYKEISHINVQIIRLWKKYIAADRYTIELVLCDSFGDKIHASISSSLVAPYESRLKEGYWKIFENFSVVQSGGAYRTSKHAYMIENGRNTRVCVCDFFPRPLTGFQPVAFRDILDGLVATEYLVDVIGKIVGVSILEIVSLNGKDTERITLELQNQFSDRLTVHLWGKYAIFVHDATQNLIQEKSIICVLRFGKLSVFKDSVSTAYGVTDVSLNPEMVEVEAFSKLFFKPIIQKSIIEVLETEQLERCIVICTIAAIDYDMRWSYMSCKICCQKVLSVPSDQMVYGIQKSQVKKKYYCAKCKTYRPELLPSP
ncbi:hypothetical protein F2Q69_00046492 [Brassica cretica]|uniref:Replication protein A 70 kDa DNA-binding subunit B/D first OB fold domain-containing protein n=1 Tax=Brassica cretica TaxID=69181 RepID=A0A8S9PSQ3_BRACR|nr:hypothetical protein F2Q69_00046492 [Brassica cretica]